MKILIGAGGTGGHIIPAIAVALELSSRGWEIAFIGNRKSMEEKLVVNYGFRFVPFYVQKLYRKLTIEHLKFPFLFVYSLYRSLIFLNKFNPDAVLCTGGYVSGPAALGSVIARKKLFFQDGNSYPGLTTKLLAKYSKAVFIASENAKKHLKKVNCILTGNPILKFPVLDKQSVKWDEMHLNRDSRKLFIIGGSQGSVIINRVIDKCVDELLNSGIEIIWQTGKSHYAKIAEKHHEKKGIYCFGFTDRMGDFYQMADLAISRAGALSIAELEEYRIPTIFIPLPTSAENHQFYNALTQQQKGVGLLLEQKNLTPESLIKAINALASSSVDYKDRLSAFPSNRATQEISDFIEKEAANTQE